MNYCEFFVFFIQFNKINKTLKKKKIDKEINIIKKRILFDRYLQFLIKKI